MRASAVAQVWRGLLLRRMDGPPDLGETVYWSKTITMSGFAFELAGWTALGSVIESEAILRRLLQIAAEDELLSYSDPKKAVFRYAGFAQGQLEACVFFAAPGADFAGIAQARRLLGQEVPPSERLSLLAGQHANAHDMGKIVCSCFSVDDTAIRGAIREHGLKTPVEIGAVLRAGTNCGSCIPELKKLLAANADRMNEVA